MQSDRNRRAAVAAARESGRRPGAALIDLVGAGAAITVAISLLMPALSQSQRAAQRSQCSENLTNLGKSFHAYEQFRGGLAPRRTGFGDGALPYGGWGSRILPYVDAKLNEKYHHDYDFYDPINKEVTETPITTFLCPAAPPGRATVIQANATGNSANPNKDTLFTAHCGPVDYIASNSLFMPKTGYGLNWPDELRSNRHQALADNEDQPLSTITDGLSHTYLLIERAGAPQVWRVGKRINKPDLFAGANNSRGAWAGWGSIAFGAFDPVEGNDHGKGDDTDCTVNCNNFFGIYGFHDDGANVLLCDGSVRFVDRRLNGLTHARLTTRDDGQPIAPDSF